MHLKTALISYFRYRRQWVCGDEVKSGADRETCDVLCLDKEGYAYDIEVKLSKADLWTGEAKKQKHEIYKKSSEGGATNTCNFFYVCVPTSLIAEARKWVINVNPKYGIIEFVNNLYPPYGSKGWENLLRIRKQAKMLHQVINYKWNRVLLKRLSSAITTVYQSKIGDYDRRQND